MRTVTVEEAAADLVTLLEQIEAGLQETITQEGVPIATLKSYTGEDYVETEAVIRQLLEFRESQSLSGLNMRGMIAQGRP